ncbi:MAG: CCA tRNA nucleotidyltransferase [Oscillospiraceae bacterium]|nr:CCA tRNA nucleotidyltransferase [Oscillospiraceae bacterium]
MEDKTFQMPIPAGILHMCERLHENGYDSYLVGGCVRDALLGIEPHDYDICTQAVPDKIIALFDDGLCKFYGKAFGTVCVHYADSEAEITTYRTESDYTDARHPGRVDFAQDVREDLARRDFTTNAIAYDPFTGLCDPYGGSDDLKNGVLRAVGVPAARFGEDALRIMRGMRFYARFGLVPEPETDRAMREAAPNLARISVERVFTELCGMLRGKHAADVLAAYADILSVWIPEIGGLVEKGLWEKTARAVGAAEVSLQSRFSLMLYHLDAETAGVILRRLRSDTKLRETVCCMLRHKDDCPSTMAELRALRRTMGDARLQRLLHLRETIAATDPDADAAAVARFKALYVECVEKALCCTLAELAVGGRDALALGLRDTTIGIALNAALTEVIEDRIPNEKAALTAFLERYV